MGKLKKVKTMHNPPFPANAQEIYNYEGDGEDMACTIVKSKNNIQLLAFRKLRLMLGEKRFREVLVKALDILVHTTSIKKPAGWLYNYLRQEADAASYVK